MLKQKLALALVLVMLLAVAGPALAVDSMGNSTVQSATYSDEEIYDQTARNCAYEMIKLEREGKLSSKYLSYSVIDLSHITKGSVTSYTYTGDNQELSIINHTVSPHPKADAVNKIALFSSHIRSMYYPENVVLLSASRYSDVVYSHVYGPQADEARYAIISGLEECLEKDPLPVTRWGGGGGGSINTKPEQPWLEKYTPENTKMMTTFKLDEPTYTVASSTSDTVVVRAMDAKPMVKNERTFVPIRYLAYALGAAEDDVHWDGSTKTATLEFEGITEVLTLGSQTLLVNDEPIQMDVAPFAENGRTFLPARWIAEPLGAQVDWDAGTQEVTIVVEQEID